MIAAKQGWANARRAALISALIAIAGCSNKAPVDASKVFAPADLSGAYVFTAGGTDSTDGDYAVAGSFVADGSGKITSGTADYNLGGGVDSGVQFTGTYSVGSSGILQMQITDGLGVQDQIVANLTKTGVSTITNYNATGTGTLQPQVSTGFTPPGDYTYTLTGKGTGNVTATGSFSAAANGIIFTGQQSFTDAGVTLNSTAVTGFVGPALGNGRGQASFGGYQFIYYLVSPTQLVLIGTDERVLLQGTATKH